MFGKKKKREEWERKERQETIRRNKRKAEYEAIMDTKIGHLNISLIQSIEFDVSDSYWLIVVYYNDDKYLRFVYYNPSLFEKDCTKITKMFNKK